MNNKTDVLAGTGKNEYRKPLQCIAIKGLKKFLYALADFFFPPKCLLCRKMILSYAEGYLCKDCLGGLSINNGPICSRCGMLFQSKQGDDHLCGRCLGRNHFFDKARAVGPYEGMLRKAIYRFKYNKKYLLAVPLGKLLSLYGGNILDIKEYDHIIPVPLHRTRLRQRGFNQSMMLAKKVGHEWGIEVMADALKRVKWTKPQAMLSQKERPKNVKGAFSYSGAELQGEKVMLIDDVFTSGSTVNECARILKTQGALKVDVLTLARTR